jgi:hypothetical protein
MEAHNRVHRAQVFIAGLVRRTWLVVLVTVIVCAGFTASAVAALVEASYLEPAPRGVSLPPPVAKQEAPTHKLPDSHELVARNMFCSTCTPAPGELGPTDSFSPEAILIATSLGGDPRATVRVPATEIQGSFGVGDVIPGVGKVDRISFVSIEVLDAAGRRGRLSLLDPAASHGDAGAATPAPMAAATEPWADRIRKIDDHTFEVDRNLVKDLVNGKVKANGLRPVPLVENGEVKGIRMFGVRDNSVAGMIGLKNSDVLVAVNNTEIKSAQTMLDLYVKLDSLNNVQFDLTRGGKPYQLQLRLR